MPEPRPDRISLHAPLLAVPIALVLVAASAAVRGPVAPAPPIELPEPPVAEEGALPFEPLPEPPRRARRAPAPRPARPEATPIRWRRMESMRCFRHLGERYCDGPLRAPVPHGAAAERARELGLADARAVGPRALHQPPDPAWLAAVTGERGRGLLWPVPDGRMWRGYGETQLLVPREDGRGVEPGEGTRVHPGVDVGAPEGSAIRAVDDGLVLYADHVMRGYGNALVVLHPDGSVTLYGHCSALLVFAGQRVRRGQVIAEVGHTGLAHGDHLHLEWRLDGAPLDPAAHFVERPGEGESN